MRGIERGRRAAMKDAPIHPEHVSRRDTHVTCTTLTEIKLTTTHCPNNNKKGTWPSQLLPAGQADEFQFFFFVQQIRIRRETISKWIAFYLERENQGKSLRLYHLRVFFTLLLSEFLIILGVPYPPCPSFALVVPFLRRGIVCRSLRVVPVTLRPVTDIVSLP